MRFWGLWFWVVLGCSGWFCGFCTFSALLREVSGFTRMDGGADAGGFGAASLLAGGSLGSRITELHTEGLRLSAALASSAAAASGAALGRAASSAGMLSGAG